MTGGNLVLDAVGKEYRTAGAPVAAVQDFSLDVGAGELHVIVGPSGCGKSTLLGAVAGFTDITSGRIDLDGQLLCGPGRPTAGIGPDRVVVFQDSTLFPWLTVADNVGYGLVAQRRLSRRDAAGIARGRLQEVGLGDVAHSYPGELSSGVQRRVEILRALVMEPAVLLLDEPFRGMDAISRSAMHDALLQIYDKFAVTVLFITHDIEEAVYLGSRVTVMTTRPGRVKTTIDIDLDRPRDRDIVTAPHFRELVGEVSDAVRDEARRAFDVGEREMVR
jgi:NitT/TauT family transport system ATP-binding protein